MASNSAETVKEPESSISAINRLLNTFRFSKLLTPNSPDSFRILFSSGNITLNTMDTPQEDYLFNMDDEAIYQHIARNRISSSARVDRITVQSDARVVVEIALFHPEKLNIRLNDGSTPLICAARLKLEAVVDKLIRAGASIDEVDSLSKTALHWAATERLEDPEERESLARADAYCAEHSELTDIVGYTKPKAVTRLLEAGADVNARDNDGGTPLHSAIESNAETACCILLKHPGINIEATMHDGATPLILASRFGIKRAFDELISAGADVKATDVDNKTPLHWVADFRYKNTQTPGLFVVTIAHSVHKLLDAGADANAQDKNGQTPLHLALESSARAVMGVLLSHSSINVNIQSTNHGGSTPLTLASRLAMEEAVSELIHAGADVNATDRFGRTALHWAASRGKTDNETARFDFEQKDKPSAVAEMLILANANVNAQDSEGYTPLHSAVLNGEINVIRALLQCPKTDLNMRSNKGVTPLMLASHYAVKSIYDNLIRAGADVHAVDSEGKTALHWTASSREDDDRRYAPLIYPDRTDFGTYRMQVITVRYSKPRAISRLLEAGADVNAREKDGRTPLHLAVKTKGAEIVRELLGHPGIDVNASMNDGTTPLILAARLALKNMVSALINAGANINAVDADGKTALHWVTSSNEEAVDYTRISRLEIARQLLDAGANPNLRDYRGRTPLDIALEEAAEDIMSMLVLHSATNLNARMYDSMTPLITIVRLEMGNEYLDLMIRAGANVNLADSSGFTALHWAVMLNNFGAVDELLRHRANPDVRDNRGQTPLHHAAGMGSTSLCRNLITKYANRDIEDYMGKLPRDIAEENGFLLIVNLLDKELMPGA